MKARLITAFYCASKWLGLFSLARHFTRRGLRVLCYHGFSLQDEHVWRPNLFITVKIFERRLQYLRDNSYTVLSLKEAMQALDAGTLPEGATVITIDDGFYSAYAIACGALAAKEFPATLYLTTYYHEKGTPIFRLAVSYLLL